ncbi:hypothetical protein T552_02419 [Pneumocystis carinii B80]|uniref:Uncharacterized protein n=2 Tax=Pneumocystis carinii TaxID=4754 RepID=A0A0W4ZGD4_PNEC8|nr:hypothetical protein T552_02419 [Pneumocystis carinii B80]ADE05567.1 chitin synthase [Pneumocystis carinii]ADE05568.1 chitin synthase [Pneumocystis carinii]KTW27441.1 hypothetical protein T552_02419 [Pneumocystis carinii B80]
MSNKDISKVQFTVGKVDAGVAILLTSDCYLVEFPSLLLPHGIQTGSILDISISRNYEAENKEKEDFQELQKKIHETFGIKKPTTPVLRVKNVTQTSVVLEWDPIELGTTELRSLTLYKNGLRLGKIPKATTTTSTKLSGLALNTEYSFQLVLKTSGGTYFSEFVIVRTHEITDLSGITVCVGELNENDKKELEQTIKRIGARPIQSKVKIDTTHFITSRTSGSEYKKAISMNIPVVTLDYIRSCDAEKKIVNVCKYYFSSDSFFEKQSPDNFELIKNFQNSFDSITKENQDIESLEENKFNSLIISDSVNLQTSLSINKTSDEINRTQIRELSPRPISEEDENNCLEN